MVEGRCQDWHSKPEAPGILGFAEGGCQGPAEPWSRRGQRTVVLSVWPQAPCLRLLCSIQFSSERPGAACLVLLNLLLWMTLTLAASPYLSSS